MLVSHSQACGMSRQLKVWPCAAVCLGQRANNAAARHVLPMWAVDGIGFSALPHSHGNATGMGHPQAGQSSHTQSSNLLSTPYPKSKTL